MVQVNSRHGIILVDSIGTRFSPIINCITKANLKVCDISEFAEGGKA